MIDRHIIFLTLCLLLFFFQSCKTSESLKNAGKKEIAKIMLDPQDIPFVSSRVKQDASRDNESSMFESVKKMWREGNYEKARYAFTNISEKIKEDNYSEWSLWRGRLFIQQLNIRESGLASENISSLYINHDDIWIGTWTGGLLRLSEPLNHKKLWDSGGPSLAVRTVNRIISAEQYIWVLRYGQLSQYDVVSTAWTMKNDLPVTERLQDILSHKGKLYLATLGDGLWVNQSSFWEKLDTPGKFITKLEMGEDNQILVGTMDSGIYIYHSEKNTWLQPPLKEAVSANITSIESYGKIIAFGTFGTGAYIWNTANNNVTHFSKNKLGDGWVLDIAFANSRWYFGTFGSGLVSWEPEENEWDRISLADGLPSADITALFVSRNGSLWVGMLNGGVVRLHRGIHENKD